MARGINKVILIGNLGKDPEVRYMPSGAAVANLTIATSDSWKDKQTGEAQERTEWHRVSMFGRLGEIAGEYLRKGSKVYIEGRLQTRKWQDQNGQDRYTTEIIANDMQMLDSRGGAQDGMPAQGQSAMAASTSTAGVANQQQPGSFPPQNKQPASASAAPSNADNFADFDDDIPF